MIKVNVTISLTQHLLPNQLFKIGGGENGGFVQNNFTSSLKSMFSPEDSLKILPTLEEFGEMAKTLAAGKDAGWGKWSRTWVGLT